MFEKKKSVWLFLLPGLAMLMIFYIVPFFSGIGYSLTDGSYKNTFVGLQNYRDLWQNSMFLLGLKNTMELSLICAPLLWVFSFLLASALSAIKPFGGFFRSSVLMPYLTPSSAILLVWLVIFDYGGPVNRALEAMGMTRVMWLTSGALRLPVVLMFLWKNLGFCLIIFLAALQSISPEYYDAARVDGANAFQRLFNVTVPLLMPAIITCTVGLTTGALKTYDILVTATEGGPGRASNTIVYYAYNISFKLKQYGYGCAMAISLIIVLLLVAVVQLKLFSKKEVQL